MPIIPHIPDKARWHGPPSAERIAWIVENFHCDWDNKLRGGYGALYLRTPQGLKKFTDFKPIPDYWRPEAIRQRVTAERLASKVDKTTQKSHESAPTLPSDLSSTKE